MAPVDSTGFRPRIATRRAQRRGDGHRRLRLGFPAIVRPRKQSSSACSSRSWAGSRYSAAQGVQGVRLAVEEANEAGGVLDGRTIELVIADDRTDLETAVERTTELIQRDQVAAICGPVTSANRDAIQPSIERFKTSPCSTRPTTRAESAAATSPATAPCPSTGSSRSSRSSPRATATALSVRQRLHLAAEDERRDPPRRGRGRRRGGRRRVHAVQVKDFTSTVRKITGSGAKVLVITVVGADAITFVKQFVAAGGKADTTIAFFGYSENYSAYQGGGRGHPLPRPTSSRPSTGRSQAFVAKVRDRFGADAGGQQHG